MATKKQKSIKEEQVNEDPFKELNEIDDDLTIETEKDFFDELEQSNLENVPEYDSKSGKIIDGSEDASQTEESVEEVEDKNELIEDETPKEEKIENIEEEQIEDNKKSTTQSPVILDDEEEISQDNSMVTVRPVKFQQFEPVEPNRTIKKNLDIMQDISMHITVELGRSISTIREVMEMTNGSVVELNKIAGEQVEIYANGKIVAKGEVIVIEDRFGVRVTSTNIVKTEE